MKKGKLSKRRAAVGAILIMLLLPSIFAITADAAINVSDNGTAEPMNFPIFELNSEGNGTGEWVNATSGFLNITNSGDTIDGSSNWIVINSSADNLTIPHPEKI